MKTNETIFVYLLDEGTDVWRPIEAVSMGNDQYRIVSENKDPEDENWQFKTGQVVRCATRRLSDGDRLVAIEKAETDSRAEPTAAESTSVGKQKVDGQ
jgi:hypothetical protein